MKREEIEQRITDLKADYVRVQSDIEKLQSVGGNAKPTEKVLDNIESELKELRRKLREASS
ncbi:hypothetical protein EV207_103192 [Scopulibacillus darangshiensis]|uniref:Uncharacterized protein n=1 Tax=Scopulibacillus darangshiensis TaxID=442528 RepID=A0A4R2P8V7_9BACL|nr:SE1832 family protein [Scopulibacillus darangshiensis]TCP31307.1 hypothetical protein EV207_103192 [Scopulibacillus darangshiensis]